MSSLRDRLKRHIKPGSDAGSEPEPSADLKAAAVSSEQEGWSRLGAVLQPGDWGDFVLRRVQIDLEHRHGHYALNELMERAVHLGRLLEFRGKRSKRGFSGRAAAGKRPGEAGQPADLLDIHKAAAGTGPQSHEPLPAAPSTALERLLFIDTETTGLGQGAGNVPFMVGIGYYEAGLFTIEQMLIRHPGEEASMLAYLSRKIGERPILISYNGKSFDWPIVKNRYIMNRIPLPDEPEGHIDFLYPSRSLWRHTLASCRLGQIEEDRLGIMRDEDVPGSMAPTLYFRYLAEREPDILSGVFRHNEWDVLTLAGLAIHFTRLLSEEADWTEVQAFGAEEWYRFGLWLDQIGMTEAAMYTMEALADDCMAPPPADAAEPKRVSPHLIPLARFFKKKKRVDRACALWRRYVLEKGNDRTAAVEPFIELSMYYEHQEKDWETALQFANQALDALWRQQSLVRLSKEEQRRSALFGSTSAGTRSMSQRERKAQEQKRAAVDELEKRIERLRGKLSGGGSGRGRKRSAKDEGQLDFPLEEHA